MADQDLLCRCAPDAAGFARQCDYCGTEWLSPRCEHDASQPQCPECDVTQAVQLPA